MIKFSKENGEIIRKRKCPTCSSVHDTARRNAIAVFEKDYLGPLGLFCFILGGFLY